nr:hypothetical protein pRERM370c [Prescottella equi]AVR64925.1 hypothetical protein pRERM470c [Prescottella equi]AVR64964.1 hypothetical protein pRERM870c [Prescottella equi]UNZ86319.1 hypothetical protein pVAPA2287_0405 [Prescottella equi]
MGKGYSTTASTPGGNLVLVDPRPGRVDAEFALAIDRPELVEDHQSREPTALQAVDHVQSRILLRRSDTLRRCRVYRVGDVGAELDHGRSIPGDSIESTVVVVNGHRSGARGSPEQRMSTTS